MQTDPKSIFSADKNADYFNRLGRGNLPELIGVEILELSGKQVNGRVAITDSHLAPNGFLNAAIPTSLADMCCGYGTIASLPKGAQGHATVELKCNFVGTARDGIVVCLAEPLHLGKATHVWDARVFHQESGRNLAHFRCTQMIFWPDSE
jgi:uncharacterized protein (TIGR00369 family)